MDGIIFFLLFGAVVLQLISQKEYRRYLEFYLGAVFLFLLLSQGAALWQGEESLSQLWERQQEEREDFQEKLLLQEEKIQEEEHEWEEAVPKD